MKRPRHLRGARGIMQEDSLGAAWKFKKSGFTALVKPPVACLVRFASADHGSLPVGVKTAMQPLASTPPPRAQIPVIPAANAVLAIGT